MNPYLPAIETDMQTYCNSLTEKDRRLYAAVETTKLGRGGITYIAGLLRLDRKTIRRGLRELRQPSRLPLERCRHKGGDVNPRF